MELIPEVPPPASDETREMDKRLATTAKQSGQVLLIKLMMFAAGFAFSAILAKVFGAAVVGEYSLMLSVVQILAIFSVFGLSAAMIKYVPIARSSDIDGEVNQVAYIALTASFGFACACALLLVLFSSVLADDVFHVPELRHLLWVAAAGLIPFTLSKVMGGIYTGAREASAYSMIFDFIDKVLLLVFLLVVALLGIRVSLFVAIAWLANQVLTITILVLRARRFGLKLGNGWKQARAHPEENRAQRKTLFGFASTMILVSVMSFLLGRMDILMIGIFRDAPDVGVYKIALMIAGLTTFIMASTNTIFPSFIAELYKTEKIEQLAAIYGAVTKWIIILTAPLVLSMILYPEAILSFFGAEYLRGTSVLIVLAIGYFISAMVGSNGYMLTMTGHERVALINNVSMAALNLGMNIVLIPRMGIVGAAIATSVSTGAVNLIKVVEVKLLMGMMPYNRTYGSVVLGIGVTAGLALLLEPFVVNAIIVAAVTMLNLLVAVAIAYYYRSETDDLVFERVAGRLGKNRKRKS